MKVVAQCLLNGTKRSTRSSFMTSNQKHVLALSQMQPVDYKFNQKRYIVSDSWAADAVKKTGEALETPAPRPDVVVDETFLKNPSPEVKKLCDQILALNVVEVHQLLMLLQTRLGISDEMLSGGGGGGGGGGAAAAAAPAAAAEPVKEKEAFDVKLGAVDAKVKIKIIKEVRVITGLGLKEAKELVEKAPVVIKAGVKKEEAEQIKKLITDAGGVVEVL